MNQISMMCLFDTHDFKNARMGENAILRYHAHLSPIGLKVHQSFLDYRRKKEDMWVGCVERKFLTK
jgi:hypothetical protein